MTYIDLLNSFWDSTRFNPIASNEALLYFYLVHQCNIRRWINPFEFKTRNLELALGLTRATISAIRNKLKQRGLIDFGKGVGSGSAVYLICGVKVTDKELAKRCCVQSLNTTLNTTLNTSLNTTLNTTLNTNADYSLYREDIRHKTKDNTTSGDVVAPVAPPQMELDLFSEEEKKKKPKKRAAKAPPDPPTLEQVNQHFLANNADRRLQNWEASARLFYDTFNADGWVNKYGRRISNWESEANKWIFYREEAEKKQQSTPKAHETQQSDRLSERRGTEPGAKSRKGFKGAF